MDPLELSVNSICQCNFRRDPSWWSAKMTRVTLTSYVTQVQQVPTSFGALTLLPPLHTLSLYAG